MENCVKKYTAECIGTFVLVFMGCGSAYFIDDLYLFGVGLVGVALAFGLSLTVLAYTLGPVSGCHINPAVSLAMWMRKKLSATDMMFYILAQCTGAFIAVFALGAILGANFETGAVNDTINLPNAGAAFAAEGILTFAFVFTVLGVTRKKENAAVAGLIIGLALTLVHIVGINLTGTSVNPARSLAPAVYNGELDDLWVFLTAPFAGGALAALASAWFHKDKEN
ncbi:MAG: aquaporin [Oscillospiraceae bacterium]|nr:aquaporin [Oscillospiraceae bacterium]